MERKPWRLPLKGLRMLQYFQGRRKAATFYVQRSAGEIGWRQVTLDAVDEFRLLPLIDFYAENAALETEPGVSYLVQAGATRVLFDLGFNGREEYTPPLVRNMRRLGVSASDLDMIVISHPHSDHLGGMRNKKERRLRLGDETDALRGKPVYTTMALHVPGGSSTVVRSPQRLAPGIATTGPLPVQLLLGYTLEQALVVNVRGAGLVVVIGCGHPGLERILNAAEGAFGLPVCGVVGGLHYPVTQDRRGRGWKKPQKWFGNPNPPWKPITRETVRGAIRLLESRPLRLVSVSAHDSCDWALAEFAEAFGDRYQPLRVGRELRLAGENRTPSEHE